MHIEHVSTQLLERIVVVFATTRLDSMAFRCVRKNRDYCVTFGS